MIIRGKILVLENKKIEFERYEEALAEVGIMCDIMTDADDFLDRLSESLPYSASEPCEYSGASLDFNINVPNRAHAASTTSGGAWLFREVLRAEETMNSFLKPEQVKAASAMPVSFLTNYEKDAELVSLQKEHEQYGTGFSIIAKKSDIEEYLAWAESAIERHPISFTVKSEIVVRYRDACLAVTRICQALGLSEEEIYDVLGMSLDKYPDNTSKKGLPERILRTFPAVQVIAPAILADRWETIALILADSIAVFDQNIPNARKDLEMGLRSFDGRSALRIIKDGSNNELTSLFYYLEQRWGRA